MFRFKRASDPAMPLKQSYLEWPVARHCSRSASVFPAYAGVVRRSACVGLRRFGLPRIRGGGPHWKNRDRCKHGSSPHTRGWSLETGEYLKCTPVFPAYAGVVPSGHGWPRRSRRLPRIRGGGPWWLDVYEQLPESSPHTRGWSVKVLLRNLSHKVFPAYAGVVPATQCGAPTKPCLPRIRGGGPQSRLTTSTIRKSSPHTRGWSLLLVLVARIAAVFPAYAGVVRFRTTPPGRR